MKFWSVQTYPSLASTQDFLKLQEEACEGTVIHALEQTAGHGRYARKWDSAKGNLTFSFLLEPSRTPLENVTLSLVTGIVLTQVIKELTSADIILKWPNDVMIEGKKCAGILLVSSGDGRIMIGIGVNIAHAPLENTACLADYNSDIPPETLLTAFLNAFEQAYQLWKAQGFATFLTDFTALTYNRGQHIQIKLPKNTITGTFEGIDENGNLLILCTNTQKLQKISAGDVFLVQ